MPEFLDTRGADFPARLDKFLAVRRAAEADVEAATAAIIADVRSRGDAALIELTGRLDRCELTPDTIALAPDDIEAACALVPAPDQEALKLAAERIRAYHAPQMPQDARWTDAVGAELGWRWSAVAAAGLYVPGGLASYPSSVLMNAIPAQVAGVERLVMCAPTRDGRVNPLVVLAARLAGIETIYRIGGAQAIAAMAYGTESVAPVDTITGPGNAWVAAAKRQVFGQVGIDLIAGPSEVLILADGNNDPDWLALDLMAQAEHDAAAQSILITTDTGLGRAVAAAVEALIPTLARRDVAEASWREHGAVIVVRNWDEALEIAERIAPEHLQVCTADSEELAARVRHAGAIFVGAWTPEAVGDYVGGPNHVLPTARSARFSSGLSVLDFLKRTTVTRVTPAALAVIGPAAVRLAEAESLQAHGLSVQARLDRLNAP